MKKLHILLVEDNEGDILLTTEALEEMQIEITLSIAKDGKDAIDIMCYECESREEEPVNLVLLDINLPKRNGHEVLEYIKTNKHCDHVPVIMLTTSSFNKDRDHALKHLADGFLTKPLDARLLPPMIRSFKNPGFNYAIKTLGNDKR